jgi:hypothetical protein
VSGARPRAGAALALCLACGGANVAVPSYPHPSFALVLRVDSAPPPAQLETLSADPPEPGCRWVDGQWVWTSQRWDWRPGGWIQPPRDCRYSAPSMAWAESQGTSALYYRPGRWYSETEPQMCPDPPPCAGSNRSDLPR